MATFGDLLYGRIETPDWLDPFLRVPEFVRLRGVRLSNVDSIEFKDFANATRWEHGVAVSYLAWRCGEARGLSTKELTELTLAGLLHDIATPPFGHTCEAVLTGFDHELETQRVLGQLTSEDSTPDSPVFGSVLPRFRRECEVFNRRYKQRIDPDEIARMVVGDGQLGFLIAGTLDLDNADNVTRGCAYMGIPTDPHVPIAIAKWLAGQSSAPTDLAGSDDPAVRKWVEYRNAYYQAFFSAGDEEFGRQACLQHILRRALDDGLPRRVMIWNTDDELLSTISRFETETHPGWITRTELVERYRLLDRTQRLFTIDIESSDTLRALNHPDAASWIERELSNDQMEAFVIVSARRFGVDERSSLFPAPCGKLSAYKLGGGLEYHHLPDWIKAIAPSSLSGGSLRKAVAAIVGKAATRWAATRPWQAVTPQRRVSVVQNLRSAGDWSFRLSRNESLHAYPSTFVHAIPATLINALGLRGGLIVDPFGGTGQTAVEAIKYEATVVSGDSNTIATLVAKARLTPLSPRQRELLAAIEVDSLGDAESIEPPEFPLRAKWHHPSTLNELCQISGFIASHRDSSVRQFMLAAFSAIIPLTTARRGLQHGFFADNTPLPADMTRPPYQDALKLFVDRIARNLDIQNRLYAFLERDGRQPSTELRHARVCQVDVRSANPSDYGIAPQSANAIVTSPPYLCMTDYTLGQRLSYYWISPHAMDGDYQNEIGARRQRSRSQIAADGYFADLAKFGVTATKLVRRGGFLATVLGEPVAERFKKARVLSKFDKMLSDLGFELMWKQWRPIHWHRNQGYRRLVKERVSVHILR